MSNNTPQTYAVYVFCSKLVNSNTSGIFTEDTIEKRNNDGSRKGID